MASQMSRNAAARQRASDPPVDGRAKSAGSHWYGSLWLPALTLILLTLSFAPLSQFYLAYIAIVPWLLFLPRTRSGLSAFLWSTLLGLLVSQANMWWLTPVTFFGTLGLVFYMSLYWGFAALLIRPLLLHPLPSSLTPLLVPPLIPTFWSALE